MPEARPPAIGPKGRVTAVVFAILANRIECECPVWIQAVAEWISVHPVVRKLRKILGHQCSEVGWELTRAELTAFDGYRSACHFALCLKEEIFEKYILQTGTSRHIGKVEPGTFQRRVVAAVRGGRQRDWCPRFSFLNGSGSVEGCLRPMESLALILIRPKYRP
jgi:hypothetical protein